MSVEIVNTTTVPVWISEGSSGVFRKFFLIDPGKKFLLRVDRFATYREYVLTTEPKNLPIGSSLTSDDFIEYSKFAIKEIEKPGDGPVWIGIPNVKRRGVTILVSRWWRDQTVKLPFVNRLTDQHVKIVEMNAGADHTIADLAPGQTFSLSVDPNVTHRYSLLTTSPNNGELGKVSSDELKLFSKIEITNTRKEYTWEATSRGRQKRFLSS